ncbi:hypothetical protein AGLY_012393, partial [Aphis glycines]
MPSFPISFGLPRLYCSYYLFTIMSLKYKPPFSPRSGKYISLADKSSPFRIVYPVYRRKGVIGGDRVTRLPLDVALNKKQVIQYNLVSRYQLWTCLIFTENVILNEVVNGWNLGVNYIYPYVHYRGQKVGIQTNKIQTTVEYVSYKLAFQNRLLSTMIPIIAFNRIKQKKRDHAIEKQKTIVMDRGFFSWKFLLRDLPLGILIRSNMKYFFFFKQRTSAGLAFVYIMRLLQPYAVLLVTLISPYKTIQKKIIQ